MKELEWQELPIMSQEQSGIRIFSEHGKVNPDSAVLLNVAEVGGTMCQHHMDHPKTL